MDLRNLHNVRFLAGTQFWRRGGAETYKGGDDSNSIISN